MTIPAKPLAVILLGLSCGLIFLGQDIRIGVRIRAFDIGMLLVSVLFIWHALTVGVRKQTGPFALAFGAFMLYVTCNGLLQASRGTAIKEFLQLSFFGLFFLSLSQYLNDRRAITLFLAAFLGMLWILAFHNAFVHISNGALAGWKELGDRKLTHSIIFVIMVIVTVSPLRPKGWWWIALLVLAVLMLFLSGERKGWIAAVAAVVPALLVSDQGGIERRALSRVFVLTAAGSAAIGLAVLAAPYVPYLDKQLTSTVDAVILLFADSAERSGADTTLSNAGRLAMIEIAMRQIQENPVFGVGPEQFQREAARLPFLPIPVDDLKGSHNELLRISAEHGLVGLGIYFIVNAVMLYRAVVLLTGMDRFDNAERLRVRLGFALFLYGFAVNVFLAGGGLNTYFVILPAGLLYSVPLPDLAPARTLSTRFPATGLSRNVILKSNEF